MTKSNITHTWRIYTIRRKSIAVFPSVYSIGGSRQQRLSSYYSYSQQRKEQKKKERKKKKSINQTDLLPWSRHGAVYCHGSPVY